jgi:CheY-like chemotaxis protein
MSSKIIPRLLAVDDDEACAELIVRLAHRSGYSGSALRDSRAFGLVLLNEHPNVITLDLSMPDIDGIEALDILRNSRFRGHLIIISGHPTCMRQHACELAKSYGLRVAGHFHKPIALKEVGDLLKRLAEDLTDATAKAKPTWTRKSDRTQDRDDSAARAL